MLTEDMRPTSNDINISDLNAGDKFYAIKELRTLKRNFDKAYLAQVYKTATNCEVMINTIIEYCIKYNLKYEKDTNFQVQVTIGNSVFIYNWLAQEEWLNRQKEIQLNTQ